MDNVRELLDAEPDIEGGVTRSRDGHIVVKMLGKNADRLVKMQQYIFGL